MISIKVTNGPLARFEWATIAAGWADRVMPAILAAIRQESPVGKGPTAGRMRDHNAVVRRTGLGTIQLVWINDTPEAAFVTKGTRPHGIDAAHARALHFETAGGDVFARHVNHPGTKPNDFPGRGYRRVAPAVIAELDKTIKEAFA